MAKRGPKRDKQRQAKAAETAVAEHRAATLKPSRAMRRRQAAERRAARKGANVSLVGTNIAVAGSRYSPCVTSVSGVTTWPIYTGTNQSGKLLLDYHLAAQTGVASVGKPPLDNTAAVKAEAPRLDDNYRVKAPARLPGEADQIDTPKPRPVVGKRYSVEAWKGVWKTGEVVAVREVSTDDWVAELRSDGTGIRYGFCRGMAYHESPAADPSPDVRKLMDDAVSAARRDIARHNEWGQERLAETAAADPMNFAPTEDNIPVPKEAPVVKLRNWIGSALYGVCAGLLTLAWCLVRLAVGTVWRVVAHVGPFNVAMHACRGVAALWDHRATHRAAVANVAHKAATDAEKPEPTVRIGDTLSDFERAAKEWRQSKSASKAAVNTLARRRNAARRAEWVHKAAKSTAASPAVNQFVGKADAVALTVLAAFAAPWLGASETVFGLAAGIVRAMVGAGFSEVVAAVGCGWSQLAAVVWLGV